MNEEHEIQEALENAIRSIMRNCVTVEGTIVAVNDDYTVDVKVGKDEVDGGSTFRNVPMMCLPATQASVIQIPALNSDCHISFLDNTLDRPQLVRVDRVERYLIGDSDTPVQVVINGGNLGGLTKVIDVTQRLNLIEQAFNSHLGKYSAHTHPVTGVGSPTGITIPDTDTLTPTTREDIENPKITQ